MVGAKRARKAETPKQPSLCLRLRAPYFYPTYTTPLVLQLALELAIFFQPISFDTFSAWHAPEV
jgi:hypothetical protein